MKRVSLGVILPGDPRRVQKQNIIHKAMNPICRYGWVLVLIVGVAFMVAAIFKSGEGLLWKGFKTLIAAVPLGYLAMLWGRFGRCSYCGHFFTMKRISENSVIGMHDRTIARKVSTGHSGVVYDLNGNIGIYDGVSTEKEYGTETVTRYTYNRRCKICGCVSKIERSRAEKRY